MSLTETPGAPTAPSTARTRSRNTAGEPRSWRPDGAEPSPMSPVTAPLPGGGQAIIFADRVRARPAITPTLSMVLGQNAVGLGVWGLCFPHSVNRFLGMDTDPNIVRLAFGARELATAGLAADPTRTDLLWTRVAGDLFDMAVLHRLDRPENPRRGAVRLALGVVLAVGALDLIAAVRMSTVKRNCV